MDVNEKAGACARSLMVTRLKITKLHEDEEYLTEARMIIQTKMSDRWQTCPY